MVVPIVVVPVFADVMTNVTRHGSRSPQEPDDLVCTSSRQYEPFWWSRELCMTAGSLSPQLSYVCFEVHMLETNERAPPMSLYAVPMLRLRSRGMAPPKVFDVDSVG